MAAVVRVKRRRKDDPVEALMISCKRRKTSTTDDIPTDETDRSQVESLLKFAATITTKDATISKHIRDAIRKEKLEKEYKQRSYGGGITDRNRQHRQVVSQSNRYKILTSYRTKGLDDLDVATVEGCEASSPDVVRCDSRTKDDTCDRINTAGCTPRESANSDGHGDFKKHPSSTSSSREGDDAKNNLCTCKPSAAQRKEKTAPYTSTCDCFSRKETISSCSASSSDVKQSSCSVECEHNSAAGSPLMQSSDKMFCLYDVEEENVVNLSPSFNNNNNNVHPASALSEFTCNSVPMTREVVPAGDPEDDYVYDLYYTNSSSVDFRMFENILKIEALQENTFVDDRLNVSDCDEVYDDDDDSNDEANWRNDYPNEDPQFYENADAEYYYGDDGLGNHIFDSEEPLSEWMSSRCNIEDDGEYLNEESPSTPYEPLFGPTATYEQYLKRIDDEIDLLDD